MNFEIIVKTKWEEAESKLLSYQDAANSRKYTFKNEFNSMKSDSSKASKVAKEPKKERKPYRKKSDAVESAEVDLSPTILSMTTEERQEAMQQILAKEQETKSAKTKAKKEREAVTDVQPLATGAELVKAKEAFEILRKIEADCTKEQIKQFVTQHNIPISQQELKTFRKLAIIDMSFKFLRERIGDQ